MVKGCGRLLQDPNWVAVKKTTSKVWNNITEKSGLGVQYSQVKCGDRSTGSTWTYFCPACARHQGLLW